MDPDRPARADRAPLDDSALALLIRDVADGWSLPPQRLDVPTWRDRVARGRGHGTGNGGAFGLGRRRSLGAGAVALVATVALSLAVVSMTRQRDPGTLGSSPSAGTAASPLASGTAAPVASPMPKLARNGDLPRPSRIMVQTGQGYHIVDLATGELSPVVIQVGLGPTGLLARPAGGWVCICGEGQNVIRLAARTVDANGIVGEPKPIRDVVGTRDPSEPDARQPFVADVSVTASPDGRLALVGWIRRDGAAGWQVGADVIDLDTLATVASTQFTLDEPIVVDGRSRLPFAPIVRLSPAGDQILLAILASVDETGRGPGPGAGHWVASFDGRSIGELAEVGATSSDVCVELDAGLIDRSSPSDEALYYAACATPAGALVVKRIAADGRLVSATEFAGGLGGIDTVTLVPPSGDAFYAWDPFGTVLSRLDLRTAELTVSEPQRPTRFGPTDPLSDLLVASADGTRIYTLGIASADQGASRESAGVYAFDAATLAPLGHWAAKADLTSIAVSADGRHVYAAADGGATAGGDPGPEFGASITAYDTASGAVVLIAGRLGARDLTLGEAICR